MAFAASPLLLVGGGKMGEALLKGWLAQGLRPQEAYIVEPDTDRSRLLAERDGVQAVGMAEALPEGLRPQAVLLAVKPQVMDAGALAAYAGRIGPETLILSIAAGKPISFFEALFGTGQPIVRAMPNTPAAVGRGTSVLCAGGAADAPARDLAETLMRAVGEVHWVEDEELLHPVTALSGGGPAYVFLLIEAMAAAGERAGLPAGLAMQLARTTVAGAGELARLSDEPAAQLRRNVTSPRGTTEAALRVLMAEDGLETLMTRGIAAASQRSRELA